VAAVALALGVTTWGLARTTLRPALLGVATGSALLVCGMALAAEPFNAWYSSRILSRSLNAVLQPSDQVAMYRTYRQSANYYLGRRVILIRTVNELEVETTGERAQAAAWFLDTREQVGRLLDSGRTFVYVPAAFADNFEAFCAPHRMYAVKAVGDTRIYTNEPVRLP
jgi:hypothetical protein